MSRSAAPPPSSRPAKRRTPQFSVRILLIVVTMVAVGAALISVLGNLADALFLLLLAAAAPVCVATLAVYCRGYRRTFFAGALGGLVLPLTILFDTPPRVHRPGTLLVLLAFEAMGILACGGTALFTRRFVERRGWNLPMEDGDRQGQEN